jgi:hypothetical protein
LSFTWPRGRRFSEKLHTGKEKRCPEPQNHGSGHRFVEFLIEPAIPRDRPQTGQPICSGEVKEAKAAPKAARAGTGVTQAKVKLTLTPIFQMIVLQRVHTGGEENRLKTT